MSSSFFIGEFDVQKAGHDEGYYGIRQCVIDCRGPLKISPTSYWGWGNRVITQSHDISSAQFSAPVIDAPVYVDDEAWITSFYILHNCHIMHHGIVGVVLHIQVMNFN